MKFSKRHLRNPNNSKDFITYIKQVYHMYHKYIKQLMLYNYDLSDIDTDS